MRFRRTMNAVASVILYTLATIGAMSILIYIVYVHPILDRTYFRTCDYYPQLTIDCREKNSKETR